MCAPISTITVAVCWRVFCELHFYFAAMPPRSLLALLVILTSVGAAAADTPVEGSSLAKSFMVQNGYVVLGPFPVINGILPQIIATTGVFYAVAFAISVYVVLQTYRIAKG